MRFSFTFFSLICRSSRNSVCKSDVTFAGVAEHSVGLLGIEIGMDIDLYICLLWISVYYIVQTAILYVCVHIYI